MEEEKTEGGIGFAVYYSYFSQSPGLCLNITLLLLSAAPFILMGYIRLLLTSWASSPLSHQQHSDTTTTFIVLSLTAFGISGFTTPLIAAVFIHLSNSLHSAMLKRVAHAPMLFFNSNPLGRIVNRFSKDTATADNLVTFQVMMWLQVSLLSLRCSTHF